MENEINFKISQQGVRFYFSKDTKTVIDVDVDDNVDTLVFGIDEKQKLFQLEKKGKVFSNITKIFIMPNVKNIHISNRMFPNVRYVASYSSNFKSGNALMKTEKNKTVLLNSFCLSENEELDLTHINEIANFALDGCMAKQINYDSFNIIKINEYSMFGSLYENEPFVDGFKKYDNFIFAADFNVDDLIFKKNDIMNYVFNNNSLIKKHYSSICISSNEQISWFFEIFERTKITADKLVLSDTLFITLEKLKRICNALHVKHVDIKNHLKLSTEDGVVYSKNKKVLFFVPTDRTKDLFVNENTTTIEHKAAANTKISKIVFPKSLKAISSKVLMDSAVKEIVFLGDKEVNISKNAFSNCKYITELSLPKVKVIHCDTFSDCTNLKMLEFVEGLISIERNAFSECTKLHSLILPSSLTHMDCSNMWNINELTTNNFEVISTIIEGCLRYSKYNIIKINYDGVSYFVPSSLDNPYEEQIVKIIESKVPSTFLEYTDYSKAKQEIAIAEYFEHNNYEMKQYIRRISKSIVTRFLQENCDEEFFIQMINEGLLSEKAIELLLNSANEYNMISLKAHILNSSCKKTKTEFRL